MAIYAIALGSNRRHGRYGSPHQVLEAAIAAIGPGVFARATPLSTAPIGPSDRHYANSAILLETEEMPEVLLARLKQIERDFGRRRGERWGARVLDLDIILWSGGCWSSPGLTIPHAAFRQRRFVLRPLGQIAPDWRDPVTGFSIHHLNARLDRARPRG